MTASRVVAEDLHSALYALANVDSIPVKIGNDKVSETIFLISDSLDDSHACLLKFIIQSASVVDNDVSYISC